MQNFGFWSLLPALITIIIAITTKRVALALFLGVLGGTFVLGKFVFLDSIINFYDYLLRSFADFERVEIALFVILIGGLLEIISFGGAYKEFAQAISKYLNSAKKTRIATWFLSFLLFFDDYANVLISGASMRSIFDKNKVSPAMLAYFVDILAGFSSVMLLSTWAAFESGLMVDSASGIGMHKAPTALFLSTLPYHFYTYFGLLLTFIVAFSGKWFSFKLDNKIFKTNAKISKTSKNAHFKHVLIPIITLLITSILCLFIFGYLAIKGDNTIENNLVNIIGNAPTIDILFGATIFSIFITVLLFFKDKVLAFKDMGKAFKKGIKGMVSVGLVIIFANGLSLISNEIGTGIYIADILKSFVSINFLPAIIFLIAFFVSVATGFSWSSMAVVMPIAYQLAYSFSKPEFIPIVSAAVITGAVFGDQVIPYSDKTVMSGVACGISPLYHVKTQIFQVLLTGVASLGGFVMIGYEFPLLWSFLIPAVFVVIIHLIFARKSKLYN